MKPPQNTRSSAKCCNYCQNRKTIQEKSRFLAAITHILPTFQMFYNKIEVAQKIKKGFPLRVI